MFNAQACNDTGEIGPTSLSHLVGQRGVIAQVEIALEAAFADNKKFDHALLLGPPGLGKSALANVIAREMAKEITVDFQEVLGQSIASVADLNALLLAANDRGIVHIDEAHEMDKTHQTALYLALDRRKVFLPGGSGRAPQSINIGDFTLLLSTTDEYRLLQPLRDRMKLHLRFEFYTPQELETLLRQRTQALRWNVDPDVFPAISLRSRGTPRLGLRLLQSCRRVCRAEGASTITTEHLEKTCELENIDALGLATTEQQYLAVVAEGPTRLNVIASRLGLPTRTVSEVVEPFLLRAELIGKDDQGRRQLSAGGRKHLARTRVLENDENQPV